MSLTAPDLIRPASGATAAPAEAYDFARPRSVSDRQLVAAEAAHGTLADGLAVALTDALGESVSVRASSLDEVLALDFRASRARPTAFFELGLGAIGPRLGLDLPPALALFLVERQLGGSDPIGDASRALSGLEQAVVETVWLPLVATAFAETWGTVPPSRVRGTADPDQIDLGADRLVVTDFTVTVGESSGTLSVAYPVETLRVLLEIAMAPPPGPPRAQSVELGAVPVDLRAELGRTRLSLGELMDLLPGDVIPLGRSASDPVPVTVGDRFRFEAQTGISGDRLALRLLTRLAPPSHD